jgi:saccharopine dehydrogenase (NAD+, L-lysine-forming)
MGLALTALRASGPSWGGEDMRALVLGCGEMGQEVVRDLERHGPFDEIVVATRDPDRARSELQDLGAGKARIAFEKAEATNAEAIASLMRDGFSVGVNCVGPNYLHEVRIARCAIAARLPLVDLNDDFETTLDMYALDGEATAAGIPIVMGLGASPGINNVLVRAAANQLDEVEEIDTAWVMTGPDPGGPALARHLLHSLSGRALTWREGRLVEVRSFVDGRETIRFPDPVGDLEVFHIGHPEPVTLSRSFPQARIINDRASFVPRFVNDWIVQLGTMVREADGPVDASGIPVDPMDFAAALFRRKCKAIRGVPLEGALRVEVRGRRSGKPRRVIFSSSGRIGLGTGIPAAVGAAMLSQGRIDGVGVLAPEACVEPDEFLFELFHRRDVGKLNGWVEG